MVLLTIAVLRLKESPPFDLLIYDQIFIYKAGNHLS